MPGQAGRAMARVPARGQGHGRRHGHDRSIALYLDMLAAERGAQTNTLDAYRRDLEDFADHLKDAGRTIGNARTDDIRAYLGALSKRGLKVTTVARRLSAIRQLYRFLYAEGHRKDDPAAVLEGPKRERALPKTLSLAEVDNLISVAGKADPAAPPAARLRAARLACLIEILYATGLRVSELVALPISAARKDARVIMVRGKGNKERLVPLNDAAKRAMADYLALLAQVDSEAPLPSLPRKREREGRGGCSRRSATAVISPASILRANSKCLPVPPGCVPPR